MLPARSEPPAAAHEGLKEAKVRVRLAGLPPGYHAVRGASGETYGLFQSGDTIVVSEFDWMQAPNRFRRV